MNHRIALALTALSFMFVVTPVTAQDDPDVKLFLAQEQLAKKGRAAAQYYLGEMYEQGLGTKQNLDEAFKWYKLSADQGHRLAKYKMAKRSEIVAQQVRDTAKEIAAEQARQQARSTQKDATEQAAAEKRAAEAAEKKRQEALAKRAKRQAEVRALLKKMEGQPEAFE